MTTTNFFLSSHFIVCLLFYISFYGNKHSQVMSVTNGSGARIFCSSPLSTQQGEASTRRTIMFIHFLIGDKQKEITKTLRSICRLVWIRELLYTKILCFECLNPDILPYKGQYALGRIFWSFPKGRIDDGRIQLCTCYANEALYLKENFPKSSKLSFSGFSETYWSEWHPGGNPIW